MLKEIKKLAACFTFVTAGTIMQTAFAGDEIPPVPDNMDTQPIVHISTDGKEEAEQSERSHFIPNPRVVTSTWKESRDVSIRNNVILLFTLGKYGIWFGTEEFEHKVVAEQGLEGTWKIFLNLDGKDHLDVVMTQCHTDSEKASFGRDATPVWLTEEEMLTEMQLFELSLAKDRGYKAREGHVAEDYAGLVAKYGGLDTLEDHIFRIIYTKKVCEYAAGGSYKQNSLRPY